MCPCIYPHPAPYLISYLAWCFLIGAQHKPRIYGIGIRESIEYFIYMVSGIFFHLFVVMAGNNTARLDLFRPTNDIIGHIFEAVVAVYIHKVNGAIGKIAKGLDAEFF